MTAPDPRTRVAEVVACRCGHDLPAHSLAYDRCCLRDGCYCCRYEADFSLVPRAPVQDLTGWLSKVDDPDDPWCDNPLTSRWVLGQDDGGNYLVPSLRHRNWWQGWPRRSNPLHWLIVWNTRRLRQVAWVEAPS